MSKTISEEVMRAAKAACDVHGIPAMGVPFVPSDACRVAMTAIMAEREACAKVAAREADVSPLSVIVRAVANRIASAIRDRTKP